MRALSRLRRLNALNRAWALAYADRLAARYANGVTGAEIIAEYDHLVAAIGPPVTTARLAARVAHELGVPVAEVLDQVREEIAEAETATDADRVRALDDAGRTP